jgi:hypothetical protein
MNDKDKDDRGKLPQPPCQSIHLAIFPLGLIDRRHKEVVNNVKSYNEHGSRTEIVICVFRLTVFNVFITRVVFSCEAQKNY